MKLCPFLLLLSAPPVALAGAAGTKGPDDTPWDKGDHTPSGKRGPNSRIVNGQDATKCEWPWQVSIQFHGSHGCGGTLIAPKWVVTAAHCLSPSMDGVVVGDYNIESSSETNEKKFGIKRQIGHPSYNSVTSVHDIALLELDGAVTPGDCVSFAALPTEHVRANTRCTTTGWGTLKSGGSLPAILQEGEVSIVAHHKCHEAYHGKITGDMICAQGKTPDGKTIDACQGDSGGPLVCEDDDKWVLHGATSWGYGCADPDYPGVWSRVYTHLSWLRGFVSDLPGESGASGGDDDDSGVCKDLDDGKTDWAGDTCKEYTESGHTDWCGEYDDDDFFSNKFCCACGGGSTGTSTGAPGQCRDTDKGAVDTWGDRCEDYTSIGHDDWCGHFDDDDFKSNEMCCICGGGKSPSRLRLFESLGPVVPLWRANGLSLAGVGAVALVGLVGLAAVRAVRGKRVQSGSQLLSVEEL